MWTITGNLKQKNEKMKANKAHQELACLAITIFQPFVFLIIHFKLRRKINWNARLCKVLYIYHVTKGRENGCTLMKRIKKQKKKQFSVLCLALNVVVVNARIHLFFFFSLSTIANYELLPATLSIRSHFNYEPSIKWL